MLALLTDPQAWLAFLTLAVLEIVLGIDNIIFLTILVMGLPRRQQNLGRVLGLSLAMLTRIAFLVAIFELTQLTAPWFTVRGVPVTARDIVLMAGGLFLLAKAVIELHRTVERSAYTGGERTVPRPAGLVSTVIQIAVLDIVFSIDSVVTAVGLAKDLEIMVAAIVAAILVMLWVSRPIGAFIERHPTIKTLALAFLILVGMALIAGALHFEIPKGYLYFAMAFSLGVELINIRVVELLGLRRKS
jgi:predicted tellurium resistance membrane protein TerC